MHLLKDSTQFPARNYTPVQVVVDTSIYLSLGDFVRYHYTTEYLFYTNRLNIDSFYRVCIYRTFIVFLAVHTLRTYCSISVLGIMSMKSVV